MGKCKWAMLVAGAMLALFLVVDREPVSLRGKKIRSLADGALQGRTIKRIWATDDVFMVEATDGSAFVCRASVTLVCEDGTRFEYRPKRLRGNR